METFLLLLSVPPALAWLYTLVVVPLRARSLGKITDLPEASKTPPRLSVIVAARNEAATIEPALTSLLEDDYPGLDVIVVNDRSSDETSAILSRLAARHSQLRVVTIASLPAGWLGKNHALARGLDATDSEYVLFTDADVHFNRGTLARVASWARAEALDHVASIPALVNHRPSLRLVIPAFSVFFLQITQPWDARNPKSPRHIGIGAFNLVRREALLEAGGFGPIRLRPDDDLMLARLLKMNGCRADFLLADAQLRVQWYRTAGEMIHGLEKNAFSQFDYRPLVTCAMMLLTLYLCWMPLAGLALLPTAAGWISLLGTIAMLAFAVMTTVMVRLAWAWGLLFPVGALLVVHATLRSMIVTLRRGGIRWRDTFYPLHELRRNRL